MISYDGLYEQLQKKGITKTDLTSELGISSRTISQLRCAFSLQGKIRQFDSSDTERGKGRPDFRRSLS